MICIHVLHHKCLWWAISCRSEFCSYVQSLYFFFPQCFYCMVVDSCKYWTVLYVFLLVCLSSFMWFFLKPSRDWPLKHNVDYVLHFTTPPSPITDQCLFSFLYTYPTLDVAEINKLFRTGKQKHVPVVLKPHNTFWGGAHWSFFIYKQTYSNSS